MVDEKDFYSTTSNIYPAECRERHTTYNGKLAVTIQWKVNGVVQGNITKNIALVPIMVKVK